MPKSSLTIVDSKHIAFAGLSWTSYSFTVADTTVPTMSDCSPANQAVNVPATTSIILKFSENVQAGTGNVVFSPVEVTASSTVISVPVSNFHISDEDMNSLYELESVNGI